MNKKSKTINILLIIILLITVILLLIFNGCSSSNDISASAEESQNISSNEGDLSVEGSNGLAAGEKNPDETTVSENENNKDTNNTTGEKEDTSSNENSDTSEEKDNSLKGIYKRFIESGKPSILVFSYDADCCPGTKAFFEEYNNKAMNLMKSYSGMFNTLFINIGILDKENMNTAIEIAAQNEVINLPSILILDSSGKSYKVIEGVFEEAEVKKILDGMLDD